MEEDEDEEDEDTDLAPAEWSASPPHEAGLVGMVKTMPYIS